MRLIFLDIDGVLNSSRYLLREDGRGLISLDRARWVDPAAVARLHRIVEGFESAHVVLTTSWVVGVGLEETCRVLCGAGLCVPILGSTPRGAQADREGEVRAYLREAAAEVKGIVILEDHWEMPGLSDWIVRTTWEGGLLDEHVAQARDVLQRPPPGDA